MIIWLLDHYYIYATIIFVMIFVGVILSVYELRSNSQKLHDMATHRTTVERITNSKSMLRISFFNRIVETVSSEELVPGDLVVIPEKSEFVVPCDMILMAGQCVVNECMLTGMLHKLLTCKR